MRSLGPGILVSVLGLSSCPWRQLPSESQQSLRCRATLQEPRVGREGGRSRGALLKPGTPEGRPRRETEHPSRGLDLETPWGAGEGHPWSAGEDSAWRVFSNPATAHFVPWSLKDL